MVGYMPASVPRLAGHRLQGDDGVDGTALRNLLKHAIEMRKVLEEERRKEEEKEKENAARSSASSAPKRTRKKKRKKKAPRGVRIRRCGQGFCSRSSLSRARMMPFTLSSLLGAGPRCAASWLICSRRTVARSSSFLAVAVQVMFPSVVAWLKMLDIMAGMDQKNSYVVLSCHGAEAVSHGPDCSADPCDSGVTVRCQVVDVLFVLVLQVPQVQFLEKVVDVPVVCNVRC